MTSATLFALAGTIVIGIGVFGLVAQRQALRRVLAFNVAGSGIFVLFGALGHRVPALGADPVPQALVITGIVVAFAATGLAVTLVLRLAEADAGTPDPPATEDGGDGPVLG